MSAVRKDTYVPRAQALCSGFCRLVQALPIAAAQAARMLLSREKMPGLLTAAGLAEPPVLLSQEVNLVWTWR